VLELTGKTAPRTGLESKFSVYHSCAAAIVHGRCGEHEYSDDVVANSVIVGLRQRVKAVATPGIHEHQVDAILTTTDGQKHHLFIEHAIGSLQRPLTDAELDGKVLDLCEPVIGKEKSGELIAASRGICRAANVAALIASANP
jgi:2-methylcitrate dehydratase PrpD